MNSDQHKRLLLKFHDLTVIRLAVFLFVIRFRFLLAHPLGHALTPRAK